jgi:hypothetical protein
MHFFSVVVKDQAGRDAVQQRFEEQQAKIAKVMARNGNAALKAVQITFPGLEIVTKLEWKEEAPLEARLIVGFSLPIDKMLEKVPKFLRGWIMKGSSTDYWFFHAKDTFKNLDVEIKHLGSD